ncbi:MAG TPA: hypothetical protein VII66_13020 [Gemmatimonadaceae bacterium]
MSTDSDLTGDLSTDVFRKHGHELIDWIAEYLDDPSKYPVLSQSHPAASGGKYQNGREACSARVGASARGECSVRD